MLQTPHAGSAAPTLVGESRALAAVRQDVRLAAASDAKVLILGETGVGKDVVARLIHHQSARAHRRFVAVNCSGVPDTLLESELFGHVRGSFTGAVRDRDGLVKQADHGTLFLDELGEMSLRMQAMLLRFAESGEVQRVGDDGRLTRTNARLITATNRDLRGAIADKTFREDLYYRLNVIQIWIPPLRERPADIAPLVEYYLQHAAATHGMPALSVSPEAMQMLQAYRWPGNVRELRNVTERLTVRCLDGVVRPEDLPADVRASEPACVASEATLATVATEAGAAATDVANQLWTRMQNGEDFWTVVHRAFAAREITRADIRAVIDRGLRETNGRYRSLLHVFNIPDSDYKRLHAFLYQQQCNLPVAGYRRQKPSGGANTAPFADPDRRPAPAHPGWAMTA